MSDVIWKLKLIIKYPLCNIWSHDFDKEICRCGTGIYLWCEYSWIGLDLKGKLLRLKNRLKFWEQIPF